MAIRKCRGVYVSDHVLFHSRLVEALLIGLAFLHLVKEKTNKQPNTHKTDEPWEKVSTSQQEVVQQT